ncbi:hypothetical protein [Nostocoides sp. HKS02]|uniref:hypothetical protein n=1 Tax=Nostocoides sp. HKS02 TaxID=1813880 RepID=UPI0012B4A247|nr:hypothetical protein [Tetrasphaera sp. HKS02]QGN58884.1 hypothetical protein GKE56_14435 [Tetrasphaera sp. HKS02]
MLMTLAGLMLAIVICIVVTVGAMFTVGYVSQSVPATALTAAIGITLVAGGPAYALRTSRKLRVRSLALGMGAGTILALLVALALGGWSLYGPYGLSQQIDRQLYPLVQAHREGFFLGADGGGHLATLSDDQGSLTFQYGRCMDTAEDGCTRPVEVTSQPAKAWPALVQGGGACQRLQPMLGVPAVIVARQVTVFTGSSAVSILVWQATTEGYIGSPPAELELLKELRRIGAHQSAQALPPPTAGTVQILRNRCGG